jgi:hypothetical protein
MLEIGATAFLIARGVATILQPSIYIYGHGSPLVVEEKSSLLEKGTNVKAKKKQVGREFMYSTNRIFSVCILDDKYSGPFKSTPAADGHPNQGILKLCQAHSTGHLESVAYCLFR